MLPVSVLQHASSWHMLSGCNSQPACPHVKQHAAAAAAAATFCSNTQHNRAHQQRCSMPASHKDPAHWFVCGWAGSCCCPCQCCNKQAAGIHSAAVKASQHAHMSNSMQLLLPLPHSPATRSTCSNTQHKLCSPAEMHHASKSRTTGTRPVQPNRPG